MVVPHGDVWPMVCSKLWDEGDVRNLAAMCDAVHDHDSLAGVELAHSGGLAHNGETRGSGRGRLPDPELTSCRGLAAGRYGSERDPAAPGGSTSRRRKRARRAGFDLITTCPALATFPELLPLPLLQQAHRRVRRLVREPAPLHRRAVREPAGRDRRLRDRDPLLPSTRWTSRTATATSASAPTGRGSGLHRRPRRPTSTTGTSTSAPSTGARTPARRASSRPTTKPSTRGWPRRCRPSRASTSAGSPTRT